MVQHGMQVRGFENLFSRLTAAGWTTEDLSVARILPDWWDDTAAKEPTLLPGVEFMVARVLNLPLATVRNPLATLPAKQ